MPPLALNVPRGRCTPFPGEAHFSLNPTLACLLIVSLCPSVPPSLASTRRPNTCHPLPCDLLPLRRSRRLDHMYARLAICTLNARYTLVYAVHADVAPTTIVLCGWRIGRSVLLELCASNARMLTDTQRRRYVLQGDSDDSTNTNDGRLSCFKAREASPQHTRNTMTPPHRSDITPMKGTAYKFRPHSKSL